MAFNLCVAEAATSNMTGGMASFGSLRCMFEQPSQDKPNLLETLSSWKHQIIPVLRPPSCTEIFGEMHFDEAKNDSPRPLSLFSSAPAFPVLLKQASDAISAEEEEKEEESGGEKPEEDSTAAKKMIGDGSSSFETMNYESLQMCTEGLGSESSYNDVEIDMRGNAMQVISEDGTTKRRLTSSGGYGYGDEGDRCVNAAGERRWGWKSHRGRREKGFPPPISSIGKSGRPSVSFKSYREEGRFVLKEVRNPAQEFLHASREDGRLTLRFIQPEDDDDYHRRREEDDDSSHEDGEIL